MRVSDRTDAEFINSAVFRITNKMYSYSAMYKIGFILLSKTNNSLAGKIRYIDFITGRIDSYIINNDMKKALIYTMLLNKKVSIVINELKNTDVNSLITF